MKKIPVVGLFFGVSVALLANGAFAEKTIIHAMRGEPPNLNWMKLSDSESHTIVGHCGEGLMRWTAKTDGSVEGGVAERWEMNEKKAKFFLRKTAKWQDGKPVRAQDFVFAWQTVLKPETASEYAFALFPMKNAEEINKGKMPATALGAKAVDDYTLEVEFASPTPYFLSLLATPTYFPVREDFFNIKKDRFHADVADILCNGPFKITQWTHGSNLTLVKNDMYWNKGLVKIDKVDVAYMTPDNSAKYNLFKDNKIDVLTPMGKDDVAKAPKDGIRVQNFPDGTMWYLEYNFRSGHPLTNKNLRKAIQYAFTDRNDYASKVVALPGTKPLFSFIPSSAKGDKKLFTQEYPGNAPKPDLAMAKKFLEAAKKDFNGKLPSIVLLCDDIPQADREAQFWQNFFKTKLGMSLKIDKQIFKQRLAKMTSGEFDIVLAGWGPDFPDVITFADLKSSWNENNRGKWKNDQYDALIRTAMGTVDQKVRMKAFADAMDIIQEESPVLTTYERVQSWAVKPQVNGIVRRIFGPEVDFTRATTTK